LTRLAFGTIFPQAPTPDMASLRRVLFTWLSSRRQFDTALIGLLEVSKAVLPLTRAQFKDLIFTSSRSGGHTAQDDATFNGGVKAKFGTRGRLVAYYSPGTRISEPIAFVRRGTRAVCPTFEAQPFPMLRLLCLNLGR
jgi:NAD(P)-dependent dehydrogenase (short-subunit alcohol dehydrogenase family)